MTFDELWEQVYLTSDLPEGARVHLPASLSDKTKAIIEKEKLRAEKLGSSGVIVGEKHPQPQ